LWLTKTALCYTVSEMSAHISGTVRDQVERGISILRDGGLVAFPTDTVYGLGACARLPEAVARVYDAKHRPRDMALPLLLAHTGQINTVASEVPEIAWLLADRFWPGALTLVLHRSGSVLDVVTGGGATVAVRVPAHPVPLALIEGVGAPVVGTSANLSGINTVITEILICNCPVNGGPDSIASYEKTRN